MSSDAKGRFTVTAGDKPAERARDPHNDIGHYFEQGALDRHSSLQSARAATLALNDELLRMGVAIDPATGVVTLLRAASGK